MYNKRNGTIYIFTTNAIGDLSAKEMLLGFFNKKKWKTWLAKPTLSIVEYKWSEVIAEEYLCTTYIGNNQKITQTNLALSVVKQGEETEASQESSPIDRFNIGTAGPYYDPVTSQSDWEFIRRYMQKMIVTNFMEKPTGAKTVYLSWWENLGKTSAFGPNYLKFWQENTFLSVVVHLIFPITIPFALITATFGWLSDATAYVVDWPPHVLKEAGLQLDPNPKASN
jgi:hypothetical protein